MSVNEKQSSKDRLANLQNDAWWEGRWMHLMHCGKKKDNLCGIQVNTAADYR